MNKNTKLKECWIWNESVSNFIKGKVRGHSLNCPCGDSTFGSVLADLDPKRKDVARVDYNELPYDSNMFDTVIQDPPWKIGYYKRMKPFFECVRVCKLGGRIIYNATWIPQSKFVELKELYVRQDGQFTNGSIISVFEKTKKYP